MDTGTATNGTVVKFPERPGQCVNAAVTVKICAENYWVPYTPPEAYEPPPSRTQFDTCRYNDGICPCVKECSKQFPGKSFFVSTETLYWPDWQSEYVTTSCKCTATDYCDIKVPESRIYDYTTQYTESIYLFSPASGGSELPGNRYISQHFGVPLISA